MQRVLPLLLLAATLFAQAPTPAPDRAACERALQQLDAAFGRGDADGYLTTFAWENRGLQNACGDRLRAVFACQCEPCPKALRRSSRIEGELRQVGNRHVALVRSEFRRGTDAAPAATELSYLAFARIMTAVRPVLQIEVGEAVLSHVREERFTCTACNYAVGGAPGWLCVPLHSGTADALEAVTFLRLGADLACDVSVHVDDAPTSAASAAAAMARNLRKLVPAAREDAVLPWLPPSLHDKAPAALTGARQRIQLPDGTCSDIYVASFGRLRHMLVVRGRPALLQQERAAIDALLASFQLLQLDADAAEIAARPIAAHQGGELNGCGYENTRAGFAVDGPGGWRAVLKAGGTAFQVVFSCAKGEGRMWVTGHALPPGLPRWRCADADRVLADLCARGHLQAVPGSEGSWQEGPVNSGCQIKDTVLRPLQPKPGEPAERHLRLAVRDDLLVVLDGWVCGKAEATILHRAFATLRRP